MTVLRDSSQKNGNLEPNHEEAPDKPDLKCIPQNSWLVIFPGINVILAKAEKLLQTEGNSRAGYLRQRVTLNWILLYEEHEWDNG